MRSILTLVELKRFLTTRTVQANISCKTIIVTFFGDVISVHGNWIWLGSLIESLAPLGYSERLVRTSVFRLVEEDWLKVNKIGRKSYYSLTDTAIKHNQKAAKRIYSATGYSNTNEWLIVLPSFVSDEKLPELKKRLMWLGFSSIARSVYAHPTFDNGSLEETLRELELSDSVIVFSGRTIDNQSSAVLKQLVFKKWNLTELQSKYNQLIETYQPIFAMTLEGNKVTGQQSFLLRLLSLHEFRRVLLQDYDLSKSMLPNDWSGSIARKLISDIYQDIKKSSCNHIVANMESQNGLLPKASSDFHTRFV